MRRMSIVIIPIIAVLTSAGVLGQGTISLLLIGDVTLGESPIQEWVQDDPGMSFALIPCNVENIPLESQYRAARIYTPRTEEDFAARFDTMVMLDTNLAFFTQDQVSRFYTMVAEYGMGIFHAPNQHKGHPVYDLFTASDLGQVFPHNYERDLGWPKERPYRVVLNRRSDLEPVLTPFLDYRIEDVPGAKYGILSARSEATVWATMIPQNIPWQISWEYGDKKARTWCTAEDVDDPWWNVLSNPYGTDVFLNIVLYISNRELPTDIPMVHELRQQFNEFRTRRGLIYGILDFADRFGANPARIDSDLAEVNDVRDQAFTSYTSQDYISASDHMKSTLDRLEAIENDAMKLKDRALFWIYIIEWLAVTGTSILAGSALWALMVRRTLYREVVTTKAEEEEE